jgi:acyl-coenzyme A thioesterase PaaI-like protein
VKTAYESDPLGLSLNFIKEGDAAKTEFVLNERHQRLSGYIHEGVIALLMDEGMGWISRNIAGVNSVTARMNIKVYELAKVGEPLVMTAGIKKNSRKLLEEYVRIERKNGSLMAEGICLQYKKGISGNEVNSSQK